MNTTENETPIAPTEEEERNQTATKRETDRKCPQCGGTMVFDPESGGLLCPFCGYKEAVADSERVDNVAQEQSFYEAEKTGNCDWGVKKKTVTCKSCGAELVYDALEVSNVCPYCGSNQVTEAFDVDTLAPNGVCAFRISAKQAADNFINWIKKRFFCPSAAKKSAKPDKMKGVYLPYWTFDAQTDTTYTAQYGIDSTYTDKDGHTHTETTWYDTAGRYSEFIDDQLVSGTKRYNRDDLKRIEPFDTSEPKEYRPEYVAGFISERYSIGLQDAWETGKQLISKRLEDNIGDEIKRENNADQVSGIRMNTFYSAVTYKYLMLPLWLSSFSYKGKIYNFMVNGQTGKVGGKTPISALRVILVTLAVIAAIALIVWLFSQAE